MAAKAATSCLPNIHHKKPSLQPRCMLQVSLLYKHSTTILIIVIIMRLQLKQHVQQTTHGPRHQCSLRKGSLHQLTYIRTEVKGYMKALLAACYALCAALWAAHDPDRQAAVRMHRQPLSCDAESCSRTPTTGCEDRPAIHAWGVQRSDKSQARAVYQHRDTQKGVRARPLRPGLLGRASCGSLSSSTMLLLSRSQICGPVGKH